MWGRFPAKTIEPRHIHALLDERSDTPAAANSIVRSLRAALTWARQRGWVTVNVAQKPGLLRTGDGHQPWEEWQIERFQRTWKLGTWERTAFELLLNTGQRGGDVAPMTLAHLRKREVSVAQEKTHERVWMPQSEALREALVAWAPHLNRKGKKVETLALLPGRGGRSVGVDRLRHRMRDAIEAAGLPDTCTIHGMRYTSATRYRELGCDWDEIADITGHQTVAMVRKYTAKRRRARATVARLDEWNRTKGTKGE